MINSIEEMKSKLQEARISNYKDQVSLLLKTIILLHTKAIYFWVWFLIACVIIIFNDIAKANYIGVVLDGIWTLFVFAFLFLENKARKKIKEMLKESEPEEKDWNKV